MVLQGFSTAKAKHHPSTSASGGTALAGKPPKKKFQFPWPWGKKKSASTTAKQDGAKDTDETQLVENHSAPSLKKRPSNAIADDFEEDPDLVQSNRDVFVYAVALTVGYMLIGAVTFSLMESWKFIDSLYFVVVTLTTVGYGDQGSFNSSDWSSEGARFFCTCYAFVGILLLGSALGIIAAEVIDSHNEAVKQLQAKILDEATGVVNAVTKKDAVEEEGDQVENDSPLTKKAKAIWSAILNAYKSAVPLFIQELMSSFQILAVVIILGMVLIKADQQELSINQCLYYAIITSTTIGYGDISPTTDLGRFFGLLYVLFGVTAVGNILSSIASKVVEAKQEKAMKKILARQITIEEFKKFDIDGDGRIERSEFALRKLMLMGILDASDVSRVEAEFDKMDADKSGEITMKDLSIHIEEQKREKERREEEKLAAKKATKASSNYENMLGGSVENV